MCETATDYERFCAVLTAYAESDFRSDARQGSTVGVFQQDPRWWPSATQGTAAQCRAFLADFRRNAREHNGAAPVHDCWITQRWSVPASDWPNAGPGFTAAPETLNYSRRLSDIPNIIAERRLP